MKKTILLALAAVLMLCGLSVSVCADEAVWVPENGGTVILPIIPGDVVEIVTKPEVPGDADGDGLVTDWDRQLFARYFAGWKGIKIDPKQADVNGNGKIDREDAMLVARYMDDWTDVEEYFKEGSKGEKLWNVTGTAVYLDENGQKNPVEFAKCFFRATDSDKYYTAVVENGVLTGKVPMRSFHFELQGADYENGVYDDFYSYAEYDFISIGSGDIDMREIVCKTVTDVSGFVVDKAGNALNGVRATIYRDTYFVVDDIRSFNEYFSFPLEKGKYTLKLTCEGYETYTVDFVVDGKVHFGDIVMQKEGGEDTHTLRVKFVDSETKEVITTEAVPDGIYSCLYSGPEETEIIETTPDAVIDNEYYFYDIPSSEYYFLDIRAPEWYVDRIYGYISVQEDTSITISLEPLKLIVGDVQVTPENCDDIFGDRTAFYNPSKFYRELILNNANIIANQPIYCNGRINIRIPENTTSVLCTSKTSTCNVIEVKELEIAGAKAEETVQRSPVIYDGGTLKLSCSNKPTFGICTKKSVEIYDVDIIFSNTSDGIRSWSGDIRCYNAKISEDSNALVPYGILEAMGHDSYEFDPYGWYACEGDIFISNCDIVKQSDGGSIIYAGGEISINSQSYIEVSGNARDMIYAREGELWIRDSVVIAKSNKTEITYPLIVASEGIRLTKLYNSGNEYSCKIELPVNGVISKISDAWGETSYEIRNSDGTYPTEIKIVPVNP